MKDSYYDILHLSPRASAELISVSYEKLKAALAPRAAAGDEDARNRLVFLEEAYATLSSETRRVAYDAKLEATAPTGAAQYTYSSDSTFLGWWGDSKTSRLLIGLALFGIAFGAYKFMGQHGDQKLQDRQVDVQSARETGANRTDAYRAESERAYIQGSMGNQGRAIDNSYDIASREADRRASATSQMLELERQQQESIIQERKWRQQQYEKEQQARIAAEGPKRQLCQLYQLNGKYADAQAAGCSQLR